MASPEEMQEITHQFKQNAEELQSFLRDLDGWQKDIQMKDDELRSKARSKFQKDVPNSEEPPEKKKVLIEDISEKTTLDLDTKTKSKEQERIRSSEYDKWDKFDVEKALQEIDQNDNSSSSTDDEDAESAMLIQQALVEKEKGNESFKRGDYDQAIRYYTKGIQLDPTNAAINANRALALLKKQNYAAAELDCSVAIEIDPTYVKAFQRRATARVSLGKITEAKADFEKILELEPNNKMAKLELAKLRGNEDSSKKTETASTTKKSDFSKNLKSALFKQNVVDEKVQPGQIFPVKKQPHQRSSKPVKRIDVIETTSEEFENLILTETRNHECSVSDALKDHCVETNLVENKCDKFEESVPDSKLPQDCAVSKNESMSSQWAQIPSKPKNSVQFFTNWRQLGKAQRFHYLDQLSPEEYPSVFKQFMEPQLFSEIISVLADQKDHEDRIGNHLVGLSKVPRVSTLTMFMSNEERKKVDELISTSEVLTRASKKDQENVKKVFCRARQ